MSEVVRLLGVLSISFLVNANPSLDESRSCEANAVKHDQTPGVGMMQTRSGLVDESTYNLTNAIREEAHFGTDCETASICMWKLPDWDNGKFGSNTLDENKMLLRHSAEFQQGCLKDESWISQSTTQYMNDACVSWRSCLGDLASSTDYTDFLDAMAIEGSFNDLKENGISIANRDVAIVGNPLPPEMWACKCFDNITSGCSTFDSDDRPDCWRAEICKMKNVGYAWKNAAVCADFEDWAPAGSSSSASASAETESLTTAPTRTPTKAPDLFIVAPTRRPTKAPTRRPTAPPAPRPAVYWSKRKSKRRTSSTKRRRGKWRSLAEVSGDDIAAELLQRAEGAPPGMGPPGMAPGERPRLDVCQRTGGNYMDTAPASKSSV